MKVTLGLCLDGLFLWIWSRQLCCARHLARTLKSLSSWGENQRSNFKVIRQGGTNSFNRHKCTLKEGRPVGHMGALGTILCKSLVLKTQTYSFNKSLFGSLETPIELLFLLREINWPNPLGEGRVEYIIMERWLSGNLLTGLMSFSFSSSYLTKIH